MASVKYLAFAAAALMHFSGIEGHGRLMDPVNRGSAFRKGFNTTENYDDAGNYCGGWAVQYEKNDGKCGECGDDYADERPRANENGGKYGSGVIVKTYKAGEEFTANVELTVNHLGFFTFNICPLRNSTDLETEECFDKHKVELVDGGYEYPVDTPREGDYLIKLRLPEGLKCERCVFRWHYHTGNSWGLCENGRGGLGCGNQETFRTCSDIKIE